jgi:hypothetical protein
VSADTAADRRSIAHDAGKGPAKANPSPCRASSTVSGWVTSNTSHRVQPYG